MVWINSTVTLMYVGGNLTNTSQGPPLSLTGATIASPIIMFMCGVIGNLLALVVLHRTRMESQRLMFHSLVAGLVWNDLIGIVLTSPVTVASYINDLQMPGGEHLCRFNGFIMICFGLSTPLIVSAMAIERFLFVKYTFFYTKHCAPGAARLIMVVIWGFVLFFGLLPMFGFGDYVLQYPRTWCFLDFRTANPVHAAYGYMYSGLNLLLVIVMVVCNLVVVVTLARVRDYRRKYSASSLNSVLIGDGVMDDSQRQQAIVRRRKQKDMELQMIVVMCAITTIFAVCWVPLMVYISLTLATQGRTADFLGLVAIRLASLNQTLNPWLYVILRRALIIRVKKYCCRWRKLWRVKSNLSPAPVMRKHQYVHVRNQLCHRNNFVGADINSDSVSDSVRKSLQQAIPAAMSLPDVMMVNTGRRDMNMPLPDVARAESFAGRVSHSCSLNNIINCVYCNSPAEFGCVQCLTERYAASRLASRPPNTKIRKSAVNEVYPKCPHNTKISGDNLEINIANNQIVYSRREDVVNGEAKTTKSQELKHNTNLGNSLDIAGESREVLVCSKHSSHSNHVHKEPDVFSETASKSGTSLKKKDKEVFSTTSSSVRGNSLRQHMHKLRNSSKSSSSKTSSSKGRQKLSASGDSQTHNNPGTERHQVRKDSAKSEILHEQNYTEQILNDSTDSDNVFNDGTEVTCLETRKDTITTDDVGFSSMPTDSVYISNASTVRTDMQTSIVNHEPYLNNNDRGHNLNHISGHTKLNNQHMPVHAQSQQAEQNDKDSAHDSMSRSDGLPSQILHLPKNNLPALMTTKTIDSKKIAFPSYSNQGRHVKLSDSSSCLLREDSDDDSDKSSGIFSAESPARSSKALISKPQFPVKKDSQSEPFHEIKLVSKQAARRVKSYN